MANKVIFKQYQPSERGAIQSLFEQTFTASDSEAEGQMVGRLVANIMQTTATSDHIGIMGKEGGQLVAGIFLTLLRFNDLVSAFLLSPVAVSSKYQGQGVGQQIINAGLELLKERQTDLVFTYGDPAYYAKVGFRGISEAQIKAPYPLQFPEGWLCQSLTANKIPTIAETPQCVSAFQQPDIW